MNATPLAMHAAGLHLAQSSQVIQWHVLGMFVPSLVAAAALTRWGAHCVGGWAIGLLLASAGVALLVPGMVGFGLSSLLLGAGWNWALLAGTTLLAQAHADHERSVAQPLMEWANSASAAVMSLLCGVLVQTVGWYAINAAMLALVMALGAWWWRGTRQEPVHAQV